MEFTVSRNRLLQALQHTRCLIRKESKGAYGCFVFTFPDAMDDGIMTVHAADGKAWLSEKVLLDEPPTSDVRPFAVWHSELLPVVKSLDEQQLHFTVGDYQLTVKHSCGTFRLPLMLMAGAFLGGQYTPDVEADDCHSFGCEAPGLRSVLSHCAFAMAHDNLRPAMSGVFVNLSDTYADYVASDGYRMVRVRKHPVCTHGTDVPLSTSFIIPDLVVRTLLKVLPPTGDVTVDYQTMLTRDKTETINGRKVTRTETIRPAVACITIDDTVTLSFCTVDSRYPNYLSVIPDGSTLTMTVDRKLLLRSVLRLTNFQGDRGYTMMTFGADKLSLISTNCEKEDYELAAEETLPCCYNGCTETFPTAGVDIFSLASILKALAAEKVVFLFTDGRSVIRISPLSQPDTEEITMILSPMHIGSR